MSLARVDSRRGFIKAAAFSAATMTMRRALGQDCDDLAMFALKYPRAQCVGVQCECALWLTRYKHCDEHPDDVEEWNIERVYTTPLIRSGENGILHRLLHHRVGQAIGSQNSEKRRIITPKKKKKIRDAIDSFLDDASEQDKSLSMTDLMLKKIYYYPDMQVNDHVRILLKELHNSGIYFPSNHVGITDGDYAVIKDLLETGKLWTYDMPYLDTMTTRPLGQMRFYDMFHTRLQDVYHLQDDHATFFALKKAKKAGILAPHKDRKLQVYPDVDIEDAAAKLIPPVVPNNRCCDVAGTGQCSGDDAPGKYCKAISAQDPHCNSMSDDCLDE